MTNILISFSTLNNPDWQKTIADLKRFQVREFALFATTIKTKEERMELFQTIKNELSHVKIPLAHIRVDFDNEEIDYLIENFGLELANIHPRMDLSFDPKRYQDKIIIENADMAFFEGLEDDDLADYAGICLDLSHLESAKLQNLSGYEKNIAAIGKYGIKANHMSAMTDHLTFIPDYNYSTFDDHRLTTLSEMDYLKQYYPKYFGKYAAIELTNNIETQLKVKDYVEKLLGL